jgi:hypothetical protein
MNTSNTTPAVKIRVRQWDAARSAAVHPGMRCPRRSGRVRQRLAAPASATGERHHRRRWLLVGADRLEQAAELNRTFVGEGLENAQAQRDRDGAVLVGPDEAYVRAAGLGAQILGGDQELLEAELAQRDLEETFILEIADAARGKHVEVEAAVAAGYDDGLGLYLRGPNRRRRKVRDRAYLRIE